MTYVIAPGARQIVQNLLVRKDRTVWAWFRVGPARWDFLSDDAKAARIQQETDVWASLAGRQVQTRVSFRPAPVQTWAYNLDARTPSPLPDVHTCGEVMDRGDLLNGACGCETWNALLIRQQQRIHQIGIDPKVVFRGFSVGTVPARFDLRARVLEFMAGGTLHPALAPIVAEEQRLFDIVRGWRGTVRMTEREQGWLRVRSIAPGVQPGRLVTKDMNGWDDLGMAALDDDTRWVEDPFGRTLTVHSWAEGVRTDTAVRVLHLSRLSDLDYPANGLAPWMTLGERLIDPDGRRFTVDWNVQGRLLHGADVQSGADLDLRRAVHLEQDYREHKEIPPSAVSRAIGIARRSRDRVASPLPSVSVTFDGTIDVIVSGQALVDANGRTLKTAVEVVEGRAATFQRAFASGGVRQEYVGAPVPSDALSRAVPGQAGDRVAYQRRFGMDVMAVALPNVSSAVGDRRGPYMGFGHGGAFMHDPFFATEGRSTGRGQNCHVVVSTLGGGKSVILGLLAVLNARRGIKTVVSDPSGPLARLAELPELAPFSQVIDLLRGRSGVLSPAALVREPDPADFEVAGEYAEARQEAMADRRSLTVEMARRCLPSGLYSHSATEDVLAGAARRHSAHHSWEMTTTLWHLIAALEELSDPHADAVAAGLRDASTAPLLRLMFPPEGGDVPTVGSFDKVLTVVTTPGISRPADGMDRSDWTAREIGADAVLRLVALFTDRLIFAKKKHERCVVIYDEAEMITDTAAGRSLLSRLGRDHSKHNIAVYLGLKSINDQMMNGELRNFIASVFAGRMANAEPALEALKLLGLDDPAFVQTLMSLSEVEAGQFVHLDVEGKIGTVKVDIDWYPALKERAPDRPHAGRR
jgi:hypothetical protein